HYFFFSSSRRHTSSKRDWSSDVCSSDLPDRAQFQIVCTGGTSGLEPQLQQFATAQDVKAVGLLSDDELIAAYSGAVALVYPSKRSEERRVGKEWRAGRWSDPGK